MEKTVTAPSEWLREIEVTIEPEKLKGRVEEMLKEYGPQTVVPGFRPGRVPRAVLERRLGGAFESGAVEELVEAAAAEAIAEMDGIPAARPRFVDLQVKPDKAIQFRIAIEVIPEFELKNYLGVPLKKETPSGFDEEFDKRLNALREKCAKFQPVARAAQAGDFVTVDYRTMEDDKDAVPPRQNVMMQVGDNLNVPEVNAALDGASAGEERPAAVTFPADYPDKNLAGKTREYRFTVREVKERLMPEVDEQLAQDLGYENLDALRKEINDAILADRAQLVRNGLKNQVFDLLVGEYTFEPPQSLVDASLERLRGQYELPDDEETRTKLDPIARKWAKFDCVVARIARKEELTVTDEEVQELARGIAEGTKKPLEDVLPLLDSPAWRNQLLRDKVMDRILEKADVT
ncbi:MAG: trigger factor [bacterium]